MLYEYHLMTVCHFRTKQKCAIMWFLFNIWSLSVFLFIHFIRLRATEDDQSQMWLTYFSFSKVQIFKCPVRLKTRFFWPVEF